MNNIDTIKNLINDFKPLIDEKPKIETNQTNGINIFKLISPIYHYENLHSDVIAKFLSPNAEHGESEVFLQLFLQLLQKIAPEIINFDLNIFGQKTIVKREKDNNIDISIVCGNNAIIIENKINNAVDMNNQIPKYYHYLKSKGKNVLGIVYLTLNQFKNPDKGSWKSTKEDLKDLEAIGKLVILLRAYEGERSNEDLKSWLKTSIQKSTDSANKFILQQYCDLIYELSDNVLDMEEMKSFSDFISKDNNYKTALELQKCLNDLRFYKSQKFYNHFNVNKTYLPFKNMGLIGALPHFKNYIIGGYNFSSDISFYDDHCLFDFHVKLPKAFVKAPSECVLKTIGMLNEFDRYDGGRFFYRFEHNFDVTRSLEPTIEVVEKFLQRLKEHEQEVEAALKVLA